ncbi:uncharacterized protein C8Q71DRAFT_740174 [Rhodofomes roseus]|uniref:DUF6533 domain-containing protein n=1 Tax=Rhodofomes roseus TaxID=34475 RepID=A0ABQ8KPT5_9APHY|nr:uncharacterized protein C8Q71DRAFT_740174 [Rhodofomes roseus]KAH9840588.1 hypothetical protein C8Q71DRAFT_740174 [Rhodofomes roseus]
MILYEHVLGLGQEIDLFWRKKLFGPALIFLANRYVLLVYGVGYLLQVPLWTTPTGCEATDFIFYIANMLLFAITGVLAALRVYAISNGDKAIGAAVLTVGMVPAVVNLYTTVRQSYAYLGVDGICSRNRDFTFGTANMYVLDAVACVCAVLSDLIVIVVTWRRTYRLWREGLRSKTALPLITLIFRDGTLYFITLLLVNVLELVVIRLLVTASSASVAYTSFTLIPVSSILISRFLVNLKQLSTKDVAIGPAYGASGAASHSANEPTNVSGSLVGNFGADLQFASHPASTVEDAHGDEEYEDDAESESAGAGDVCET